MGLMAYCVMSMILLGGVVRYRHCVTCQDLATAARTADHWNRSIGYKGRYFVVSQKEYEDLWRK